MMTCQPIGSKNSPFRHIQFVPEGKISNLGPLGLDRPHHARTQACHTLIG